MSGLFDRGIEQIKTDLDLEGIKEGTPQYDFQFLERKVKLCQERRRVMSCQTCSYYEDCTLVKEYALCKIYKQPPPKANP